MPLFYFFAKVEAMTQRLHRLNVNAASLSAPLPSIWICGLLAIWLWIVKLIIL